MNKTKTALAYSTLSLISLVIYAYLCYLMIAICLQYFPWQTDQHFLLLKQDVVNTQPWQAAFKIHVISSSFVLIAGFTQFFRVFRTRYPRIHRWSGWLYIITILGLSLPSGLIFSFFSGWRVIHTNQLCLIKFTLGDHHPIRFILFIEKALDFTS